MYRVIIKLIKKKKNLCCGILTSGQLFIPLSRLPQVKAFQLFGDHIYDGKGKPFGEEDHNLTKNGKGSFVCNVPWIGHHTPSL